MHHFIFICAFTSLVFVYACSPVQPSIVPYSYDSRVLIGEKEDYIISQPSGLLVINDSTCIVIQRKVAPNLIIDLRTGVIRGSIWPPDTLMEYLVDAASRIMDDSSFIYLSYDDAMGRDDFKDLPQRKSFVTPKYGEMDIVDDSTIGVCCHSYVPAIRKGPEGGPGMAPITGIVQLSTRDFSIRRVTLLRPRHHAYTQFQYFRSLPNNEWWSSAWDLHDSLPPDAPRPVMVKFTSEGRQTDAILYVPEGMAPGEYYRPAPQLANVDTERSFFLNDETGMISILDLKNRMIIPTIGLSEDVRSALRMDSTTQFLGIATANHRLNVIAATSKHNPDKSRFVLLKMKYERDNSTVTLHGAEELQPGARIEGINYVRSGNRVDEVRLTMVGDSWYLDRKAVR